MAGWGGTFILGILGAFGDTAAAYTMPWIAAATLAWSGVWLIAVPNSPRFRRAVDAAYAEQYGNDYGYQLADLREKISIDYSDQVEQITELRGKARKILTEKFGTHDLFAQDNLAKLDTLAINYLKLAAALSEYEEYLSLVDPEGIERDLAEAQDAADAEDEILRAARMRQVSLLQNRLTRYRKAQERIKLIQAQCRNVETTMKLLVDQAMTAADPARVGRDIDQVLENIRSSEILTEELATYDDLERELEDTRLRELE